MIKINFNICLTESIDMNLFINLIEKTSQVFESENWNFEYTSNLRKTIYAEKRFNDFDSFKKFYESKDYRFDLLKLKSRENDDFIGFQYTRGGLRVFGNIIEKELFFKIITLFEQYVLFAYCHNDLDITLSRIDTHRSWIRKIGKIPSYVKLLPNRESTSERDKCLIYLESVPTHHHYVKVGDKLWFGACAIMYFSELYYKYISKIKWENFTDCEENVVLENGLRKIVLYSDLSDFENPINRSKQWAFRNQLGIDDIAHKLIPPVSSKGDE